MSQPQVPSTQEDRVIAGACHLAPFVGFPVVAPFAVYFWKKDNRYVAFHALQAAIFHLVGIPLVVGGYIVGVVGSLFLGIVGEQARLGVGAAIGAGGVLLVSIAAPALVLLTITIFAAFRAFTGVPYKIPLIGAFVDRILDAPAVPPPPAATTP
jgi:uncharacterized Tic20 family protein